MALREDIVASAVQFLQDPSVASSSLESRLAFLRQKNLTQEEIDAALTRAGTYPPQYPQASPAATPAQQYYQPYPQYAWQQPPPVPRRDWRDWFIMATVMGGVGYGLFELTKRYVYPLIAPPTPERLEQDKKAIDEQFEKAFGLIEQLAKDTDAVKSAERERTEKLDGTLSELESVMSELKSAHRRREDEAQRIRDDIQSLKDSIPRAMEAQKALADSRLREVNTELASLKTLLAQRMSSATAASTSNHLRPTSGNASAAGLGTKPSATGSENAVGENTATLGTSEASMGLDLGGGSGRNTPFGSGNTAKPSIPAWQLMASKGPGSATNGSDSAGGAQSEASVV